MVKIELEKSLKHHKKIFLLAHCVCVSCVSVCSLLFKIPILIEKELVLGR